MYGDPEDVATDAAAVDDSQPAGTDAADATTDSGEGKSKTVTIPFDEYMSLKKKREEENRARKVESGERDHATDTRSPDTRTLQRNVSNREERLARLRMAAREAEKQGVTDSDAHVLLDVLETAQEAEQRQLFRMEMRDIPESKRDAVLEAIRKRGGSPWATYKWLRGDEADVLEAENKSLREQVEKGRAPKPKVEGTKMPAAVARGAAAKNEDGVIEISPADYARDSTDPAKWAAFKKARREGKLRIVQK